MEPPVPSLGVVVVAHDRREYLLSAVDSVRSQLSHGSDVELVVVKNFEDPALDQQLEDRRARRVLEYDPRLGAKLRAGMDASRSDVLCILEDDDEFAANKLAIVRSMFRDRPRLGFYHNGFVTIGPDGAPWQPHRLWAKRGFETSDEVSLAGPLRAARESLRLLGFFPNFNCSSISIRRAMIEPFLTSLPASGLVADNFLFLCALASPWELLADRRALTRVRVHSSNLSPQGGAVTRGVSGLRSYSEVTRGGDPSLDTLLNSAPSPALQRLVAASRARDRAVESLRSAEMSRQEAWSELVELARLHDTYYAREHRALLPVLGLALVAPALGRAVYAMGKTLGY